MNLNAPPALTDNAHPDAAGRRTRIGGGPASATPEYIVNSARSLTLATILVIRARADHVGGVDDRCECKP
jgi:hypothetical protein